MHETLTRTRTEETNSVDNGMLLCLNPATEAYYSPPTVISCISRDALVQPSPRNGAVANEFAVRTDLADFGRALSLV